MAPPPDRTRIKICGIRDWPAAQAAADAGADAVGFVFAKSSPRYIEPAEAARLMADLPPFVVTVGLFVDPDLDEFVTVEEQCPTHYTQFHGSEPVELVRQCGPDIIKAVRFDRARIESDLRKWGAIDEVAAVLVDGSAGGMGEAFDWTALRAPAEACPKPVILAGGLTPENVREAIAAVRPWAVDVSSGVERERGVKDASLIRAFCAAVRA
ncbi:MAG: N-(5'-phosphoribosyl)anthranilate isomerase [Phycisphaerales bacterium JB039]